MALTEKLRKQASHRGHDSLSDLWARKQAEVEQEAEVIRRAIERGEREVADIEADA
jgi:hypothetical protein